MIVMKFGGSSLKDVERIRNMTSIVSSFKDKKPIVVLSATGGTTDKLIDKAGEAYETGKADINEVIERHKLMLKDLNLDPNLLDEIFKEMTEVFDVIASVRDKSNKIMDHVQSFGERISTRIAAAYLNSIDLKAKNYDAFDVGFITDSKFLGADLLPEAEGEIKKALSNLDHIAIVTGFIGKNKEGQITTLGRGGSDYTAAIIGAALGYEEIQIWTDVDGMMTTDPRIVKNVKTIPEISFAEAAELAAFGAKVLHPKTILPAVKKNIPVKVLNTYNPTHPGTTIVKDAQVSSDIVRAISSKKKTTLINVTSTRMLLAHGFLAKLFEIFDKNNLSIDMIATSEVSVSLTIDSKLNEKAIENAVNEIKKFAEVTVNKDMAIICLVGNGMKDTVGVIGRVFNTVAEKDISVHMVSQGASEINIGFIVDEIDADKTVKALHNEFIR